MKTTSHSAGTFDLHSEDLDLFELLLDRDEIDQDLESARIARRNRTHAPLSFAQSRLWFLQQMEPDSPSYNMPGGLRLSGNLSHQSLWNSVAEIVRRHESLRTAFANVDGEGVQLITFADDFNMYDGYLLSCVDLSGIAKEVGRATLARVTAEQAR